MNIFVKTLHQTASSSPERTALVGYRESLSYGDLDRVLTNAVRDLKAQEIRALGLYANNGIPWALADLSALVSNVPLVPLPLFFSPKQIQHVILDAGLEALLTDRPQQVEALLQNTNIRFKKVGELRGLHLIRLHGVAAKKLPHGTAKITYTSGNTGEPKGVCLGLSQMEAVAISLRDASQALATDCHLCLTPLSTLLENIGGIYTPLLAGACSCLLPLEKVGLVGASGIDASQMLQAMHEYKVSSAILVPQMLQKLVVAVESGVSIPSDLRFVAVGGAPVSPSLLQRAHHMGIPVFEGYGLSECSSVVTLNTPSSHRPGSVGRPLPHISISFSSNGEILVSGSVFLGYLGQEYPPQPFPTGDLGYLDDEGFLHLTGRRKNLFITSFGRKVAPEWVESELTLHTAIAQAAVFGEDMAFNVAIIVIRPGFSRFQVSAAVELTNHSLPDYARVASWVLATAPFSPSNHQMTPNGRLKRETIQATYAGALESLYRKKTNVVL